MFREDFGGIAQGGILRTVCISSEGLAICEITMKIQSIDGDDKVAQIECIVLGEGGNQRPGARGTSALTEN